MIGPEHITYASKNHNGMLGEETVKKVRCAHSGCNLSYDDHTSDLVAFLQARKEMSKSQANISLKHIVDNIDKNLVDGFAFVESDYKILPDEKLPTEDVILEE